MKIMIVTPYFAPAVGGLENYALNIAKGLQKKGDEVFIVTANHIDKKYREDKLCDLRVIRLPISFRLSNTPIGLNWKKQIKRIIEDEKPDVINAHTPVPFISDIAIRAAGKTPTILTYHNDLVKPSGISKYLAKLFYVLLMNKTLEKAEKIIATSEYYANVSPYLRQYKEKVVIVPPGVDIDVYSSKVDKNWLRKKYPNKKIILFVASMKKSHAHKGLDVLIDSCAKLKKKGIGFALIAAGTGDGIDGYKQHAKRAGILTECHFPGFVPDEDLPKYYAGAHVLTLPSISSAEGFGMVLLEAQACGTPVIGTDIGGIPYAIGDSKSGLLVNPRSSLQLYRALASVLKNYSSLTKTTQPIERVKNSFDWKILSGQTADIFLSSTRKRVLHVTSYYPPHLGGMESVVKSIANTQYSQGIKVGVITSRQKQSSVKEPFPVKRLWNFEFANTPFIPSLLLHLIKQGKEYDIFHVHIAQAYTPEMVWLASIITRTKYIAQIHLDVAPSGRMGILLKPYKSIFLSHVLKSAHAVTVFTKAQKDETISKYKLNKKRVFVVPNGVEEEYFYKARTKLAKKPRLLFVGRLSPQKNITQLLNALDGISEKFETNIVGDGILKQALMQEAEDLNLKNIRFLGRKSGRDLIEIYKNSDIFVLPSEREGMPLVLLEAMAMGLPVVATDVVGIRDLIKDNKLGKLASYGNPNMLKQKITSIDNAVYIKLSRSVFSFVSEYKWKAITSLLEDIYD